MSSIRDQVRGRRRYLDTYTTAEYVGLVVALAWIVFGVVFLILGQFAGGDL